ncbi:hypothetical protein N0V85_004944 [Neurospora sp. IMI 360204]|nr:hypothetical protein N0V85_004944 [Neurospora sp. IMI 360204]
MRVRVLKAQLAGSSSENESRKGLVADTSAKDETMVETERQRVELQVLRALIKRDFLRWVTPASASASQSKDKGKMKDDATSKVPENTIPEQYRAVGEVLAAVLGTEEYRIACSSPPKEEAGEGSSALAGPSRTQSERPVVEDQDVLCLIDRLRSLLAHADGIGEALRFDRGLQKWQKGDLDLRLTVGEVLAASRMEPGSTVSPELMVAARKRDLAAARKIAAAGAAAADEDVVGDASAGNPANSENIASLRGGGLDEPDCWNALEEDS